MKKLIALLLALSLALALCACGAQTEAPAEETAAADSQTEAKPEDKPTVWTVGSLSLLNMTEEEYAVFVAARRMVSEQMVKEGYVVLTEDVPELPPEDSEIHIVLYDTLDALLMALNVGDIDRIEIYQSVARYLCAANDNLRIRFIYDMDKEQNAFAELMVTGILGNDFAFLMMEDNAALRDEFNAAIEAMKADGTMDRLVQEQIDGLIEGGEFKAVELPKFDGAETIKVAVTGSLPPMDYVAADGSPAGFNTAVLAEIGNRLGKNIELVVVDSLGRAAALASGAVDAVFWTRTSGSSQEWNAFTEEERQAKKAEHNADLTEEEVKLMDELRKNIDYFAYARADMPEGTIVTVPYFTDVIVPVFLVP